MKATEVTETEEKKSKFEQGGESERPRPGRRWSSGIAGAFLFLAFVGVLAGLILTRPRCSGRKHQPHQAQVPVRQPSAPRPAAPTTPTAEIDGERVVIINRLDDVSGGDPVTITGSFGERVVNGGDTLILRLSPGRYRVRISYASPSNNAAFGGLYDIIVTAPEWRTAPDGRQFFCSALVWV